MQQDFKKPKKPIQGRNRKAKDISLQKHDVFQLINQVPKIIKYTATYSTYEDNLAFNENCVFFLEKLHPKSLKNIKFNPDFDDIFSMQATLMKAIADLGYMFEIDTDENMSANTQLCVLYDVPWNTHHFFNFDVKIIESLPEEMKIGFAKWINCMSRITSTDDSYDFFDGGWTNFNDSPLRNHEYYLEMFYEEENPLGSYDEIKEITKKFAKEEMPFYKEKLAMVKSYEAKPISIFKKYQPNTDLLKQLKERMLFGIEKIDWSAWNKFANNANYMEDGGVNYEQTAFIMWDSDKGLEENILQEMHHRTNEGACDACGWIISNNGQINRTTKRDVKMFELIQKNILEVADVAYDHYNKIFA